MWPCPVPPWSQLTKDQEQQSLGVCIKIAFLWRLLAVTFQRQFCSSKRAISWLHWKTFNNQLYFLFNLEILDFKHFPFVYQLHFRYLVRAWFSRFGCRGRCIFRRDLLPHCWLTLLSGGGESRRERESGEEKTESWSISLATLTLTSCWLLSAFAGSWVAKFSLLWLWPIHHSLILQGIYYTVFNAKYPGPSLSS